jgi:hypothetical protein
MRSIKNYLVSDFEGKAKEALNERMTENMTFFEQAEDCHKDLTNSVIPMGWSGNEKNKS